MRFLLTRSPTPKVNERRNGKPLEGENNAKYKYRTAALRSHFSLSLSFFFFYSSISRVHLKRDAKSRRSHVERFRLPGSLTLSINFSWKRSSWREEADSDKIVCRIFFFCFFLLSPDDSSPIHTIDRSFVRSFVRILIHRRRWAF